MLQLVEYKIFNRDVICQMEFDKKAARIAVNDSEYNSDGVRYLVPTNSEAEFTELLKEFDFYAEREDALIPAVEIQVEFSEIDLGYGVDADDIRPVNVTASKKKFAAVLKTAIENGYPEATVTVTETPNNKVTVKIVDGIRDLFDDIVDEEHTKAYAENCIGSMYSDFDAWVVNFDHEVKYNLEADLGDRERFDNMVDTLCETTTDPLTQDEILEIDVADYVKVAWEQEKDTLAVDDIDEAKERFFAVYTRTLKDIIADAKSD